MTTHVFGSVLNAYTREREPVAAILNYQAGLDIIGGGIGAYNLDSKVNRPPVFVTDLPHATVVEWPSSVSALTSDGEEMAKPPEGGLLLTEGQSVTLYVNGDETSNNVKLTVRRLPSEN